MAALDTNILIRYLVQDDAAQLAAARRLIRRCVEREESRQRIADAVNGKIGGCRSTLPPFA